MSFPDVFLKAARRIHPRLGLKKSDVILASFPRSGNTWVRFIWANIVSLLELGGREVDFYFLNRELAAEYDTFSYGRLEYRSLPRLVKTHARYRPRVFSPNRIVYLHRHPGDVAISYHNYLSKRRDRLIAGLSLSAFLKDKSFGIPAWCEHVTGWQSAADLLIRYEDLEDDAVAVSRKLIALANGSQIDADVIREAVERSLFQRLRRMEQLKGRPGQQEFDRGFRFVRRSGSGHWRRQLASGDRAYLQSQLAKWNLQHLYA